MKSKTDLIQRGKIVLNQQQMCRICLCMICSSYFQWAQYRVVCACVLMHQWVGGWLIKFIKPWWLLWKRDWILNVSTKSQMDEIIALQEWGWSNLVLWPTFLCWWRVDVATSCLIKLEVNKCDVVLWQRRQRQRLYETSSIQLPNASKDVSDADFHNRHITVVSLYWTCPREVYLRVCVCVCVCVYLSVADCDWLCLYLSVCLSVCLPFACVYVFGAECPFSVLLFYYSRVLLNKIQTWSHHGICF